MNWNELAKRIHGNAVEKGFWPMDPAGCTTRTLSECLALIHSELSEALEDDREGQAAEYFVLDKPCGVVSELADVVIRTLDTLQGFWPDTDINAVMRAHRPELDPYLRVPLTFAEAITNMHAIVSRAHAQRLILPDHTLATLIQACESAAYEYEPDLPFAEVIERKVSYNETRSLKHGKRY